MNEPKLVDPNLDPNPEPNNVPPEGDKPPEGDENTAEHWSQKYGESENKVGALRDEVATEKANANYWQRMAQQNAQPAPQAQENGNINLDPMEEGFGKNLVGIIDKTVRKVYREESAVENVQKQTDYLVEKYKVTSAVANNILSFGYQNGATNAEHAKQIFSNNFGNLGTQLLGQQPPTNQDPNPNPNPAPNQIKYDVTPPLVPAGGVGGSDSAKIKMPPADEWNKMTDEQKRDLDKKIIDGKVEFDSTHAKFTTQP